MSTANSQATLTVALVGNPNTGKSTLFTALAGVRQRIGNYPGVTVEKKIGQMQHRGHRWALIDLPGTYSLAPHSPDEMVVVDVLLGRRDDTPCDAILCIVDASNLERNLYLVSQVLELGLPTVVAMNMTDIAESRGLKIDAAKLAERLGIPVVPVQANKRRGLDELKAALAATLGRQAVPRESPFPQAFREEVTRLEALLNAAPGNGSTHATNGHLRSDPLPKSAGAVVPRYLAERLLLDTGGYLERTAVIGGNGHAESHAGQVREHLLSARARLAAAGLPVPAVEALVRYDWAARQLDGVISRPAARSETLTDKIDRILTHRLWGTAVFVIVMVALFSSIFMAAEPLMKLLDGGAHTLGEAVKSHMPDGALRSLLVDGLIAGAGSVIVFLPQVLILFMFIAILEDCGYMARAAYLMDKLMVRVGLSGKSFIPLLSSFACAIPGIMATRVIENRRDRLTTIMVAPLMSCSARLPVYTLLIGAFIPAQKYVAGVLPLQGLTLFVMYLVGVLAAIVVALILKRTLLRGATPPFVMELPPYKFPSPALVVHRMLERGWAFVKRAGTLIVAVAIVVWALLYYPHNPAAVEANLQQDKAALAAQIEQLPAGDEHRHFLEAELARYNDPQQHEQLLAGAYQRQSILGHMGRWIEPAVRPLGWDWRVGCAAIASFPAREVVLGTLGVIYNLGNVDLEEAQGQTQLQTQLRNATWDGGLRTVFTVPMALGLMVFFALCAQCAATLVIIKRETNSWRWPAFTFTYMTVLAYVGALATYQIGTWLAG
ncbi:MAG TPA: ferrous iron transport protein B [Pirellulales bacterium]|nr:ferrous iron transport protein B [Pirellulales bacterium]